MVLIRYHLFHFLFSIFSVCFSIITEDSLVLVHVVFRHGERTVEPASMYPNDPYINKTDGYLTMNGKVQEYRLGQVLRSRYDRFLGPNFDTDMVEALTSDMSRTKMSLLLVLAGLFPPNDEELIDVGLNWQPIPYSYRPSNEDRIFDGIGCPNFGNFIETFLASEAIQHEIQMNKQLFEYLSEFSGKNITSFSGAFSLYDVVRTEEKLGLLPPKWVENIYPQLQKAAMRSYHLKMGTDNLRRLAVGYMLQKIIHDTMRKISGDEKSTKMKLHLYSGHEYNLTFLLILFELFDEEEPPFGSYLSFEIHYMEKTYGIKIFYQNYAEDEPKLLKLPWCTEFCPLEQFISSLTLYMPTEELCGN